MEGPFVARFVAFLTFKGGHSRRRSEDLKHLGLLIESANAGTASMPEALDRLTACVPKEVQSCDAHQNEVSSTTACEGKQHLQVVLDVTVYPTHETRRRTDDT